MNSRGYDTFDITVIGGGIIGLSISYYLSKFIKNILILEKENKLGQINSTRNTEVIHAGIYYKNNSLKAKLSLTGKELLYNFCKKYKVRHKKIGKFFIPNDNNTNSINQLELILNQAKSNGLLNLKFVDKKYLKIHEPNLNSSIALLSPSSGIIDSLGMIDTLEALNLNNNVIIANKSAFTNATYKNKMWNLNINNDYNYNIKTKIVINCAGLNSLEISKKIFGNNSYFHYPVKGSYLRYTGHSPFNHIIYPSFVPGVIKERVDATPDIHGGLRFGPSIEKTQSNEDFSTPLNLKEKLYNSIKSYFPNISKEKINLDISGIRPKIRTTTNDNPDFVFDLKNDSWLDIFGIESPGLTACLAIAKHVRKKISIIY